MSPNLLSRNLPSSLCCIHLQDMSPVHRHSNMHMMILLGWQQLLHRLKWWCANKHVVCMPQPYSHHTYVLTSRPRWYYLSNYPVSFCTQVWENEENLSTFQSAWFVIHLLDLFFHLLNRGEMMIGTQYFLIVIMLWHNYYIIPIYKILPFFQ